MEHSKIRNAVISELIALEQFTNEDEAEKRRELLMKILDTVYDYEHHMIQYNFNATIQSFCDRGMEFSPIKNTEQIKQTWDDIFTNKVPDAKKGEIYFDDFKWHVFSYNVLNPIEKECANTSFLHCKKSDVYVFFQHTNTCYKIENLHLLEEGDITNPNIVNCISDFYIFDTTQKWTYIYTHEESCGPYFYQVK